MYSVFSDQLTEHKAIGYRALFSASRVRSYFVIEDNFLKRVVGSTCLIKRREKGNRRKEELLR
jgi:hypothetical protein